jgi:V/A-type H+-transporting ATPase subunit K
MAAERSIYMKKCFFVIFILLISAAIFAQETVASEGNSTSSSGMWKYIAAALSVGISCIAGGMAVGRIGSAAMGAMSENADLSGKALPYAGLAEGICLWGFLVALLILIL